MHLSLLLFSCLLLCIYGNEPTPTAYWKGQTVTIRDVRGFKHVDAWRVLEGLSHLERRAIFNNLSYHPVQEQNYLCRVKYCHAKHLHPCVEVCQQLSAKIDHKLVDKRIMGFTSTEAAPNKAVCQKECNALCGKKDCETECVSLCEVHYSFDNRREYESEFKELMMRVFRKEKRNKIE